MVVGAAVPLRSGTAAVVVDIRLASKDDPDICAPLADTGAVSLLATQLGAPGTTGVDAAAALLNISISEREQLMSVPGLLDALTAALRTAAAAATVHSILCDEAHRATTVVRWPLLVTKDAPSRRSSPAGGRRSAPLSRISGCGTCGLWPELPLPPCDAVRQFASSVRGISLREQEQLKRQNAFAFTCWS
jgi:hypothetical protein